MYKLKKILLVAVTFLMLIPLSLVNAEEVTTTSEQITDSPIASPVPIYFFKSSTCSFCAAAKDFFTSIEDTYGDKFDLIEYEVAVKENSDLMYDVLETMGVDYTGVPVYVIGDKLMVGYIEDFNTTIINNIEEAYNSTNRYDVMDNLIERTGMDSETVVIIISLIIIVAMIGVLVGYAKVKANNDIKIAEEAEAKRVRVAKATKSKTKSVNKKK